MISRITFCSAQAPVTRAWRLGPMPGSFSSSSGLSSITSKTRSPKAWTSLRAKWGPMPLTMPEPR
jgi:hypothetical protein